MGAEVSLTPAELAERWRGNVTLKTLSHWRSSGAGPRFLKVGRKVLYPMDEVEAWETTRTMAKVGEGRAPS